MIFFNLSEYAGSFFDFMKISLNVNCVLGFSFYTFFRSPYWCYYKVCNMCKVTQKCESAMWLVTRQAILQLDIQSFWKPVRNSEFCGISWRKEEFKLRRNIDSLFHWLLSIRQCIVSVSAFNIPISFLVLNMLVCFCFLWRPDYQTIPVINLFEVSQNFQPTSDSGSWLIQRLHQQQNSNSTKTNISGDQVVLEMEPVLQEKGEMSQHSSQREEAAIECERGSFKAYWRMQDWLYNCQTSWQW